MSASPPGRWALAGLYAGMVVAWGLNFIFVKIGIQSSPALWLATFRALLGTAGVAAGLVAWRTGTPLTRLERRDSLLLGIPTTALFFGLWFQGASEISPGEVAVIVYTFPLWVVILSALLLSEQPARWTWLGVTIGFIGIVLLEQPWVGGSGRIPPVAVAELLVAAVCWAGGTVGLKARIRSSALRSANGVQLASGAGVLLVGALLLEPHPTIVVNTPFLESVLWLGLVGTAFANVAWFALLARYPAHTISTWAFLTPVVALVASVLIFGEHFDDVQVLGVVAVLAGVVVVARVDAPENVEAETGG